MGRGAPINHSSQSGKRSGTIQSVSIAARFLNILANAEEPLALGELARRAQTGNSTAHRYVQSLVREGFATQDSVSGLYDLGPAALNVGIAALRRIDPVEIASDHMKELATRYAMTAGVAIWTERGPTIVRWYRSAYFSVGSVGLGDILPIDNTATGLVFQAFLPANRIEPVRQVQAEHFTGNRPTPEILEQVRATCMAELSGHLFPEIAGQAVPVFDAQQEIACVMATVANLGAIRDMEDRVALYKHAKIVAKKTGGYAAFERASSFDNL